MSDDRLHYGDLDKDLLVWGNHMGDGVVVATGRGENGWGEHYYHPDLGWTSAATGRPIEREQDERER